MVEGDHCRPRGLHDRLRAVAGGKRATQVAATGGEVTAHGLNHPAGDLGAPGSVQVNGRFAAYFFSQCGELFSQGLRIKIYHV